jgi:hypothetical protein
LIAQRASTVRAKTRGGGPRGSLRRAAGGRDPRQRRLNAVAVVLVMFSPVRYPPPMTDPPDKLTPADPRDLADAIAFALRYCGGKRVRDADEVMATIAARRIVEHLRGARYRVMKRPLAERAARRELAAPLSPAEPEDVIKAIAFGLRFESGRRVWQADEYMALITAKRLIEHLTLDGFVVLKLPPLGGHSALGQGFQG